MTALRVTRMYGSSVANVSSDGSNFIENAGHTIHPSEHDLQAVANSAPQLPYYLSSNEPEDDIDTADDDAPVDKFLLWWRGNYEIHHILQSASNDYIPPIGENARKLEKDARPDVITSSYMQETGSDIQGINWCWLEASKRDALSLRKWKLQLNWTRPVDRSLQKTHELLRSYNYRFSSFRTTFRPRRGTWQLCNSVAAPSSACTFYASGSQVFRVTPCSPKPILIFDAATSSRLGAFSSIESTVRAIASSHGTLACGTWEGSVYLKSLYAPTEAPFYSSRLPTAVAAPVNHISLHLPRQSCLPVACVSSNAPTLPIIDIPTLRLLSNHLVPWAIDPSTTVLPTTISTSTSPSSASHDQDPFHFISTHAAHPYPNATAASPDSRLRLVAGDTTRPLILDAESGARLVALPAHGDHAFAAAWSPGGIHAATASQDGCVHVYDARRWGSPIFAGFASAVRARAAAARYLEFSPLGAGKSALLVAEAQDVVGIINIGGPTLETETETMAARSKTWAGPGRRYRDSGQSLGNAEGARQDWEFLGVVAGAGFVGGADGDGSFVVGVQDRCVGGLMEFERTNKRSWELARSELSGTGGWAF